MQALIAEVIDAVVRKEEGFMGIGEKEHVEYIVKLKKGENLKILSKRFSDLHTFHQTLNEQNVIDRATAPVFPDKQVMREGWYKFDHTDTNSDFVRARKEALNTYLFKLFEAFPLLYHEPYVIAFFSLEFELAAALAISAAASSPAAAAMPRKTRRRCTRGHAGHAPHRGRAARAVEPAAARAAARARGAGARGGVRRDARYGAPPRHPLAAGTPRRTGCSVSRPRAAEVAAARS